MKDQPKSSSNRFMGLGLIALNLLRPLGVGGMFVRLAIMSRIHIYRRLRAA